MRIRLVWQQLVYAVMFCLFCVSNVIADPIDKYLFVNKEDSIKVYKALDELIDVSAYLQKEYYWVRFALI